MYCTYSGENGWILPGAMARSGVAWPDLGKGRRRRPLIDDGGIAPAVIEHGIDAAMMTVQPFEEAIGAVCESDSPGFGRRERQDRKSVVSGKRVAVRVAVGGCWIIEKKKNM